MKSATAPKPLVGKALLKQLKELDSLSRREKARACGYVSVVKDGQERVNIGNFINAVLDAKGISLDLDEGKNGRGREASYRVSVHKNGQIVLGETYTQKMGLKVGDEFEIKLGYKHIHLVQIGEDAARD
jgi:AbrB-like transcriptional regulator